MIVENYKIWRIKRGKVIESIFKKFNQAIGLAFNRLIAFMSIYTQSI